MTIYYGPIASYFLMGKNTGGTRSSCKSAASKQNKSISKRTGRAGGTTKSHHQNQNFSNKRRASSQAHSSQVKRRKNTKVDRGGQKGATQIMDILYNMAQVNY